MCAFFSPKIRYIVPKQRDFRLQHKNKRIIHKFMWRVEGGWKETECTVQLKKNEAHSAIQNKSLLRESGSNYSKVAEFLEAEAAQLQ